MRQPLPPAILNTQFATEVIRDHVATDYAMGGPIACEFIRRGFNDHYLITTPEAKYVFRVYFQGKYYIASADDFRFELELLDHLLRQGVPVAAAVPRADGCLLGTLLGEEGIRYCALFRYAEGKEREALTPQRGLRLGETMARFHAASDSYRSVYSRYQFNLEYLVERPMTRIQSVFQHYGRENELEPFLPAIAEWQSQIRRLPTVGPAYGIIHGDPHSGNYRVTEDGQITLFDFDHGGYGWRAYDIAVCKGGLDEETWQAFLEGYQGVRTLAAEELEAIPAFRKVRPIWDQGDILAMYPVWGELLPEADYCDKIITIFAKITT